ncbi:MAG: hypothetical protein V9F01_04220 [Chitinophagaceae bacterium]
MKTIQVDNDVLNSLYGDSKDSLNEVFSAYISSYHEMKQNLSSAFCSGNLNSLKRLLHFHGPSYMYLGMPQLANMFNALEQKCAQVGNHFAISSDFAELMQLIENSYLQIANEVVYLKKAI